MSGIYSRPTGIDAVANNTIDSGKYNSNVADVEADLNLPRPIVAGGTGASDARTARDNLGAEVSSLAQLVTNYNTQVWDSGSFASAAGATGAPNGSEHFMGVAILLNANRDYVALQAIGHQSGNIYTNLKQAGVWTGWVLNATNDANYVKKTGDTMSGTLVALGGVRLEPTGVNSIFLSSPNTIIRGGTAGGIYLQSGAGTNWASFGDAGIQTIYGNLNVFQVSAPTTGTLQLGNSTGKYLQFNGTNFNFVGGMIVVGNSAISYNGSIHLGYAAGTNGIICHPTVDSLNSSVFLNAAGAIVGTIQSSSTVTAYNTSSDERLKEDLRDLTNGGTVIDAVKVYDFRWKSTQERDVGIIAQKVYEQFPGAISRTPTVDGTDFTWLVDYAKFVPLLLDETKRLRKRVADLEAVIGTAGTILQRLDVLDKFREKIEAL